MQIQAIHFFDFVFGFHSFFFNCGDFYCTQTTLYIFFVEIFFESKKYILIF
jgi:hypothetical protein